MKTTRQRDLMLIITVFVLLLSLFNAGTVFADDGVPPAEPIPTEEPIPDDAPDITTEPTATVIDQPIEEFAGEGTSAETTDQTVSEILEQMPEDTQLIVLDENGVIEPLVTQNAAEIIATSDPMWCPAGQTPGGGGCTAGYATAALLVSALNGVTGDGTIYFMPTYSTNDLTFDHTNVNLSGLGALTIQGGWNGSTGNAFALSGSTTFNGVGLTVTNWASAVTINDIIVNRASGDGITVDTTSDIHLDDVSSNNNGSDGTALDNTSGMGNVTITGANTFNGNGNSGLYVLSNGDIKLNNITADWNNYGMGGAWLDNTSGSGSVIMTGSNSFSSNNQLGLVVTSHGDIRLNNVTASWNINGSGASLSNHTGTGSVILTGTNIFSRNGDSGLGIFARGNIEVNNITANDNQAHDGATLANFGTGFITLIGANTFNDNNDHGLSISSNGNTTLNNITTSGNGMNGLRVESNADVNIKCGSFKNNAQYGVYANMPGILTLNGVAFSGNTSGDVNLTGGGSLVTNADCATPSSSSPYQVETQNKPFTGKSLPLQFIPITSGNAEFNCELFSGTVLSLPNGDKVTFKCPVIGTSSLSTISTDELPGDLPEGVEYISGIQAGQSVKGNDTVLDALFTISFVIPEEVKSEKLSILYWDGNEWIDLKEAAFEDGRFVINGGYFTDDGYFESVTNFSGSFVLVKK